MPKKILNNNKEISGYFTQCLADDAMLASIKIVALLPIFYEPMSHIPLLGVYPPLEESSAKRMKRLPAFGWERNEENSGISSSARHYPKSESEGNETPACRQAGSGVSGASGFRIMFAYI